MGGCTIVGLRSHYFDCDVCMNWYWGHEDDPESCVNREHPDCQTGITIVQSDEKLRQQRLHPWQTSDRGVILEA